MARSGAKLLDDFVIFEHPLCILLVLTQDAVSCITLRRCTGNASIVSLLCFHDNFVYLKIIYYDIDEFGQINSSLYTHIWRGLSILVCWYIYSWEFCATIGSSFFILLCFLLSWFSSIFELLIVKNVILFLFLLVTF